jgi:hypothetical protein
MYNVLVMKSFKVAEARARLGELLDEAESGQTVFIERHGVRFILTADRKEAPAAPPASPIKWVHPDVMSGQWTWDLSPKGLRFRPRRRRK